MMHEIILSSTRQRYSSTYGKKHSEDWRGHPLLLHGPPDRVEMAGRPSEKEGGVCLVFCFLRNQDAEMNLIIRLSGGTIELENG